jgi:hypothetical protein
VPVVPVALKAEAGGLRKIETRLGSIARPRLTKTKQKKTTKKPTLLTPKKSLKYLK